MLTKQQRNSVVSYDRSVSNQDPAVIFNPTKSALLEREYAMIALRKVPRLWRSWKMKHKNDANTSSQNGVNKSVPGNNVTGCVSLHRGSSTDPLSPLRKRASLKSSPKHSEGAPVHLITTARRKSMEESSEGSRSWTIVRLGSESHYSPQRRATASARNRSHSALVPLYDQHCSATEKSPKQDAGDKYSHPTDAEMLMELYADRMAGLEANQLQLALCLRELRRDIKQELTRYRAELLSEMHRKRDTPEVIASTISSGHSNPYRGPQRNHPTKTLVSPYPPKEGFLDSSKDCWDRQAKTVKTLISPSPPTSPCQKFPSINIFMIYEKHDRAELEKDEMTQRDALLQRAFRWQHDGKQQQRKSHCNNLESDTRPNNITVKSAPSEICVRSSQVTDRSAGKMEDYVHTQPSFSLSPAFSGTDADALSRNSKTDANECVYTPTTKILEQGLEGQRKFSSLRRRLHYLC